MVQPRICPWDPRKGLCLSQEDLKGQVVRVEETQVRSTLKGKVEAAWDRHTVPLRLPVLYLLACGPLLLLQSLQGGCSQYLYFLPSWNLLRIPVIPSSIYLCER